MAAHLFLTEFLSSDFLKSWNLFSVHIWTPGQTKTSHWTLIYPPAVSVQSHGLFVIFRIWDWDFLLIFLSRVREKNWFYRLIWVCGLGRFVWFLEPRSSIVLIYDDRRFTCEHVLSNGCWPQRKCEQLPLKLQSALLTSLQLAFKPGREIQFASLNFYC